MRLLILVFPLFAITALFHNCGQFETQGNSSNFSTSCAADMLPLFEDTYHDFFKTNNCKNCHAPGGISGIPHFAQSDSVAALTVVANQFQIKNLPDKIENKLKTGHQGYTFSNFSQQLASYKTQWMDGLNAGVCKGSTTLTTVKTIDFFEPHPTYSNVNILKTSMTDWQTITWTVPGKFNDVQFTVEIKVSVDDVGAIQNYFVRNLKIKTARNIHVKKIYILLNKKTYFVTTYSGLDLIVNANSDFQNITEGFASGIFIKDSSEKYQNSDGWTLEIETLEEAE